MFKKLSSHPLIRNVVMLYGVQIGNYVLPLLLLPYLSRVLSPDRFGLIAYGQFFVYYFLVLTDYGFDLTATRRIAIVSDNRQEVSAIFNGVMAARILLMFLGLAVMVGIVFAIPKLRQNALLFFICYAGVVGNVLFPRFLFQGMQLMQHIAFRDIGAKLLSFIAVIVFVKSDADYLLCAGLQSAGMLLAGCISLLMLPRLIPVKLKAPSWSVVSEHLREGWPVFLSLAANTTYTSTNTFLLGLIASPAMVAYYSNAFRVIVAVRSMVSPVVTAIYPHVSRMAAGSHDDAMRFLRRYALVLSAPFLLVSVGLLFFGPFAVRIVFGPKYAYTGMLLQIMALSPFLYALAHYYSTYFMLAFGYRKEWSRMVFYCAIVNFAVLLPLLKLIPPAIALAITGLAIDLFAVGYSYVFFRKHAPRPTPNRLLTVEAG